MKESEYKNGRPQDDRPQSGRRAAPQKKRRRKRRRLSGFGRALIFITLLAVAAAVCAAVFLKVENITASGGSVYSAQQIEQASGIKKGANLLRVDKKAAEKRICSALPYAESAQIDLIPPDTVKITVKQAAVTYVLAESSKADYIYTDTGFKVLEVSHDNKTASSMPVFTGVTAKTPSPGKILQFVDGGTASEITSLLAAAKSSGLKKITLIDITDSNQVTMTYDGRIKILLGTPLDAADKMNSAAVIITRNLQPSDKGTLDVSTQDKKRFVFSPS